MKEVRRIRRSRLFGRVVGEAVAVCPDRAPRRAAGRGIAGGRRDEILHYASARSRARGGASPICDTPGTDSPSQAGGLQRRVLGRVNGQSFDRRNGCRVASELAGSFTRISNSCAAGEGCAPRRSNREKFRTEIQGIDV